MPVFTLNTNLPKDKIPDDFLKKTAEVIQQTLGKPISYVIVHVNPDQLISFGGGNEPCASATLMSIGALGKQENKKHSAALYKHIEKTLGITSDKMYIQYINANKADVGYVGKTFDDLL
ncbi:macrophage migration inhibitory factor homolog [Limulus polyphemus]|uniref:L-dopachrome isomerase n=1 Tax=Limulus polyphemus TaxID=6850 RepID=A0ABM1B0Y4_LIMPO|nr:macrophage migration inhibitory factor homolog [Limulus polyphemus]